MKKSTGTTTTKSPKSSKGESRQPILTEDQREAAIAEFFSDNVEDLRLALKMARDHLGAVDHRSVGVVHEMIGGVDDASLIAPVLEAAKLRAAKLGVPGAASGVAEALLDEADLADNNWSLEDIADLAKRVGSDAAFGDLVAIACSDKRAAKRLEHALALASELFPGQPGAAVTVYEAVYSTPE